MKSRLIRKDPDAGKIKGKKGATEDEMVRQHHRLNGHEPEQIPGDSERWGTWRAAVHRVVKSQTGLGNLTTNISQD